MLGLKVEVGAETSGKLFFFGYSEPQGIFAPRCELKDNRFLSTSDGFERNSRWFAGSSEFFLQQQKILSDKSIRVVQELKASGPSLIQDFVLRLIVEKSLVHQVHILGRTFVHEEKNRWLQFRTSEITLETVAGQVIFRGHAEGLPPSCELVTYCRDEGNNWIIHFRVFPIKGQSVPWVRWKPRWGTVQLAPKMARFVEQSFPALWDWMWYRSERDSGKHQFQAQGLVEIGASNVLRLEAIGVLQ